MTLKSWKKVAYYLDRFFSIGSFFLSFQRVYIISVIFLVLESDPFLSKRALNLNGGGDGTSSLLFPLSAERLILCCRVLCLF